MLSDFVKYVKQYWHDRPDKSTPLNADRLNHIENGIASNSEAINQIANAVVSNIVNDPEKIASMAAVYALQEKLGTGELPSDAPNAISAINTLYSNFNSHVATISLPAAVETTANNIIKNCKACCASMQEAYKIHIFCGHNSGYATIIGYTYETSETTRYALFLFQSIASNDLYVCRCYEGNWVVYEIKGTKLE